MGMVELGSCWDVVADGVTGDEEFQNLLTILDFPMESLEGDGFVGDWDISKSQYLGPIPSNVLMGPPTITNSKIDTGPPHLLPVPIASIAGAQEQKQLSNHVDASGSHILQQNNSEVQESSVFQTQSPVSVLESSGSCSAGKSLAIKSHNAIPVRTRSKRVRPAGVNPWLLMSPCFATSSASKKTLNARKDKQRRKKLSQVPVAMGPMKEPPEKVENSFQVSDCAELQNSSSHRPAVAKKCTHCEVTKTPQWREGPLGPKTLCNACGVRYRSGRLFPEYRPAASPTFIPSLHSNSHKKVIEMRNKAKQPATKIEEAPISPQPEFIPMSSYLFDYIY